MTRKLTWSIWCCLACLTLLPGCQLIPSFTSKSDTGAKSLPAPRDDRESDHAPHVKPPQDLPAVEMPPKQEAIEPEKMPDLPPAVVPERGPDLREVKANTPPPLPPPLTDKKREYAALAQALQDLFDGRHEEAMKQLRTYDEATQEVFLRILPLLTNLAKKPLDEMSPAEVAVMIESMRSFLRPLIPRSELTIHKMNLCKWVKSYGNYQPLPENYAFLTGTESRIGEQVQLYIELLNFESRLTKEGDFLTKLACSLELHDNMGKKVWSKSFDANETTHRRRSPMNDFYSNYSFYVPAIPAGTYQLTIHVADETDAKHRREASESLVFRVTPAVTQTPPR